MQEIIANAQANKQRIVLPEGDEPRTLKAADRLLADGVADIILIGPAEKIKEMTAEFGLKNIDKARIIDPKNNPDKQKYADLLYELRKAKGMTPEQADDLAQNFMYLGILMVKAGEADGLVSGARSTTGDMLRPALQIIKTVPGVTCVSGAFTMFLPEGCPYGTNGRMVFADCAVTPMPTAEQLAEIAICTADTAKAIAKIDPITAILSFSTKGSAKHEVVDKVIEATRIAKERRPDLVLDGELQADAAIVPKLLAAPSPARPTHSCSPASKSATSLISSSNVWLVPKPSVPCCKASPSPATTSVAAAPSTTFTNWSPSPAIRLSHRRSNYNL